MARTLNNEVDVLNIASLDNDIKDSFTRAMITEDVNTTSAAARRYLEGEYFIHTDRYLYKALEDIAAGTIITPDVNAEVVTVSEELVRLFAQSPEAIFEILSNVENTSVASKNYVKGSQFIWTDKKLYEATADIASGSTFVVDTNIKLAENFTSQIKTLANNDTAVINILGAKNLCPNDAVNQTLNGVVFQINSQVHSKNYKAISAAGTNDGSALSILELGTVTLPYGTYILSGCPSGGSGTTYALNAYDSSNINAIDYGDGATFDVGYSGATVTIRFIVYRNASIEASIFPMIRPASIEDDTYVTYTMTNRELTTGVIKIKKALNESYIIDGTTASSTSYATLTGLNNKLKQIDDKMLFIVVGVANVIYTICIFSSALGSNQTHEFRTGSERDTIKVTWNGPINGGTLQLKSCVIDGVEYNTNSETYMDIYD